MNNWVVCNQSPSGATRNTLWLLEPVDGPGGETKSKTWALTPGPGGDLLEDLVPPGPGVWDFGAFTHSGDWLPILSVGSFYCIRDPLSVTYIL